MTTRDTPECQRQQAVLNDAFGPGLVREATAATRERVVKDLQRMGLEMAGGEVPVGTVGSHHEHVGATLNWLVSAGHSVTVKPCNYNAGAGASVALDMDEPTIFRDYSVIGALAQAVAWSQREGYTP